MKLQQYLLNHYLHIPFEDFSHKAVVALGILTSIKYNPLSDTDDKQKKELDDAINKVKKIIEITNEDTQINLFILDRNISPQDFSKTPTLHIINFKRIKPVKGQDKIQMSSDQIQKALCEAIMEINTLLMKEIAGFSDQMFLDDGGL